MIINVELPKYPVGTKFLLRRKNRQDIAEVVGYHIEHETTTGITDVKYIAIHEFMGQKIKEVVPRSTVRMNLVNQ